MLFKSLYYSSADGEKVDFNSMAKTESHFYLFKDWIYNSDLGSASDRLNLSLNSQEETLHESMGAKKNDCFCHRVTCSQKDYLLVNVIMDNILTQHTLLAIFSREAFGAATLVRTHADATIQAGGATGGWGQKRIAS